MLFAPRHSGFFWTYDNWGANPASTIGTQVTSGAANAKGSWAQVASSANMSEDSYAMYIQFHSGSASGNTRPHLVDIGVDPAGGTSYGPIIENLQVGAAPALTVAGAREHFFPFYIQKGSSVAIRSQANFTGTTFRAAVRFYGRPTTPEMFPKGRYSETFGADPSNSGATPFTPGNASDGGWTLLGTSTKPLWWWQLGYYIRNTNITAEYTYIELAYGDGTNYHPIFEVMHGGTTGETCGLAAQTQLLWCAAYAYVPAGSGIYVRGRCNNAPDAGYQAMAVGIGG